MKYTLKNCILFIMLHICMLCCTVVALAQFMQHTLQWSVSTFKCWAVSFSASSGQERQAYAVLHCAPELMLLALSHLINNY